MREEIVEGCIDVIAISGKAHSGKTTLSQIASQLGYKEVDISGFLAEIVRFREGLREDEFNKEEFRLEINKIGKQIDQIIPVFVVNKMEFGGKYVIPSVKDFKQIEQIEKWGKLQKKVLNIKTILIRSNKSFDDGVRTEVGAPDFIIYNNGSLEDLKTRFLETIGK